MALAHFLFRLGDIGGVAPPPTDTHDGDVATPDEIRRLEKAMRAVRASRDKTERKRQQSERRLADLIDRTYRKVVLNEPEVAAEIAAAVADVPVAADVLPSSEVLRNAIVGDPDLMADVADRLRDWLWRQEQPRLDMLAAEHAAEMAEEDDIETLLLLVN